MQVPPEIVLKDVAMTPVIDKVINRGIARLERICRTIISVRIALEREQGRHQNGNAYRMRIDIRIPDRADIIVRRTSKAMKKVPDEAVPVDTGLEKVEPESETIRRGQLPRWGIREEPLRSLIRRSFDSARRELEKEMDRQRGDVKSHPQQQIQAVIEKIFREEGYGFLRTVDGQQVYFHRNSVLHDHWQRLAVGTAVHYALGTGEKGLQVSTVEPVDKPGAAEMHARLHDLPRVA